MTADAFTRDKFNWLEQIVADATLPPTAARLAIILSTFVNRGTGDAFPSIPTLAGRLCVVENAVRKSLRSMVDGGHLEVDAGGGRNATNRYRWILKSSTRVKGIEEEKPCTGVKGKGQKASTHVKGNGKKPSTVVKGLSAKTLHGRSENPSLAFTKPCTPVNPNNMNNTIDEPIDERLYLETDFDRFWLTYPKKVGKAAARKAFDKAMAAGVAASEIIAGAARYAAERDREPDAEKRARFTKHPTTWLNGGCWDDEPAPLAVHSYGGNGHLRHLEDLDRD